MPLYEFVCDECKIETTRMIALKDLEEQYRIQMCDGCGAFLRKIISVPALHGTDTKFMANQYRDDGFGGDNRSRRIAKAKAEAAGISTAGKIWHGGLCRKGVPFDPQAWFSEPSEVVKKAEKLGRNVEGMIHHHTPVRDEHYAKAEAPYKCSREVVAEDVRTEVEGRFGTTATPKQVDEIFDKHVEKHSGSRI